MEGDFAADPTGRYERSSEVLGRGAFKQVYRAYDTETGLEVAWNQLIDAIPSRPVAEKLLEEIRILQTLQCPQIIAVFHSWIASAGDSFRVVFITELMTGGTLRSFLKRTGPASLKPAVISAIGKQVAQGLAYLHSRDPPILHRDLKCDNIFINGNCGQVKIGDLGLAIIKRRERKCLSTVLGTPEFMAPEMYDEQYDERVDCYAFGMCLLELATKEYPYAECENAAQIYRKVTSSVKPVALARLPEGSSLRLLIESCLSTDPRKRPPAAALLTHPFFSGDSLDRVCRVTEVSLPFIYFEYTDSGKLLKFSMNVLNGETPHQVATEMCRLEIASDVSSVERLVIDALQLWMKSDAHSWESLVAQLTLPQRKASVSPPVKFKPASTIPLKSSTFVGSPSKGNFISIFEAEPVESDLLIDFDDSWSGHAHRTPLSDSVDLLSIE